MTLFRTPCAAGCQLLLVRLTLLLLLKLSNDLLLAPYFLSRGFGKLFFNCFLLSLLKK